MTGEEALPRTLIQYTDNYGIERTIFMEGDFTLGRIEQDNCCDMVFKDSVGTGTKIMPCDRSVSRKHARVFWNDGKLYVQDMGSVNGTFINGHPLQGWSKKNASVPLHIPTRVKIAIAKEYVFDIEPYKEKGEVEKIMAQAGVAPGTPVVINIDQSKHIGSMDIVANRSTLIVDSENLDELGEPTEKKKPGAPEAHRSLDSKESKKKKGPPPPE